MSSYNCVLLRYSILFYIITYCYSREYIGLMPYLDGVNARTVSVRIVNCSDFYNYPMSGFVYKNNIFCCLLA